MPVWPRVHPWGSPAAAPGWWSWMWPGSSYPGSPHLHITKKLLKGQCHEIFCFWFLSWISFPPATEYPIRTVFNFFENSRRYSQVKVHHRYQRQRWQICHWCQQHRRQTDSWKKPEVEIFVTLSKGDFFNTVKGGFFCFIFYFLRTKAPNLYLRSLSQRKIIKIPSNLSGVLIKWLSRIYFSPNDLQNALWPR